MRPISALAVPVLAAATLVACAGSPAAGVGSAPPGSGGSPDVAVASGPATPSPSVEMTPAPPVPSTCHLTQPTHPFIPPAAYPAPARPPDPGTEWYGTARLWTILTRDGEVWDGLPLGADGLLTQKTFWWSADFDVHNEQKPAITITGKRLDGPGLLAAPAPGTNAQADFGSAMLQGIGIPTSGCWQITATYRGASLSYVVWVG